METGPSPIRASVRGSTPMVPGGAGEGEDEARGDTGRQEVLLYCTVSSVSVAMERRP